jgi:hypothetical protein
MRQLLAVLLALAASTYCAASDFRFVRVWPEYRTAESFVRISEYFTGKENPGRQTYLRTQPDQRAGFYFLSRIANGGPAAPAAKIQLQVITQHDPRPRTHVFTADIPHGERVFLIGLTGTDWTAPTEQPVAWKVSVLAADGQELAGEQSYLWSKPAQK